MKVKVTLRELIQIAMLIALAFVLERLMPIVNLPTFRLTLACIPMMCCGMLFGPVWGAAAYGIADVLGWPLMGLMPIPLILLSRVVNGFLFGLVLHHENIRFWPHAFLSAITTQIICSMGLTTLGLSLFIGTPYIPLLVSRLPADMVYIALLIAVFPVLLRLRDSLRKAGYVSA